MAYRDLFRLARVPLGIFRDPALGGSGRWILYSALVGTVAGFGAIAFDLVFRGCQWLFLDRIGRFVPPAAGGEGGAGHPPELIWLLPLCLVLGGLLAGALVFGLAPEAEGHGTDAVIKAFHHGRGKIRGRVPIVKALSSAITIGSGGSAGREGPIAQIGAGFGSILASLLGLTNRDRRILMMAGVAGGIGGIFKAPLGATLFAGEVLYRTTDFEDEVLLPCLISSITSYSIYSSYAGWGFLFDVPAISFHQPRHLLLYALLGIVCAAVGAAYPKIFYGVRDRIFRPMRIPAWTKPALGALALGAIALVFPEALGMGYGYIQQAIQGERTVVFLLLFAAVKIVATSLTISSGGSGGVFGPSLVIGGALGGAFGVAALEYLPGYSPSDPAAFVMVGMGGFFAGVAKVPFASVIMVVEMTGSYGLLVPSLLVATMAFLFLPQSVGLYENQIPRRIDSPVHQGSFATDLLRSVRVGESWTPSSSHLTTVAAGTPLSDLVDLASTTAQTFFPVVDEDDRLVGELDLEDLRRALLSDKPKKDVTAGTLSRRVRHPLVPEDDLATAARRLAAHHADEITVVRSREDREVLGVFGRRDLIVAYGRRLQGLQRQAEAEARLDAQRQASAPALPWTRRKKGGPGS